MKKFMKNIKVMTGLGVMVALFAVAGVAHGGVSWSGIDPIFIVDGHQFNVFIEWPSQFTCTIEEPIEVSVRAPSDSSYVFISESSEDVGNCGQPQRTVTTVRFDENAHNVKIETLVNSAEDFPVNVEVYLNGDLVRVYEKESNKSISGKPVKLP